MYFEKVLVSFEDLCVFLNKKIIENKRKKKQKWGKGRKEKRPSH